MKAINFFSARKKIFSPLIVLAIVLFSCNTNKSETNTTRGDSLTSMNIAAVDKSAAVASDNILTIHGKNIWIRDEPNIGKVTLKLNEGDRCRILEAGRFDVINGKANLWYKIEINGQTGWVFGSQTDQPGFMFECENPFRVMDSLKLTNHNIDAASFNQFWENLIFFFKKKEFHEEVDGEEIAALSVEVDSNRILVGHFTDCGMYSSETFTKKYVTNQLALISYENRTGCSGWYEFGATLVAFVKNSKWSFAVELEGGVELTRELSNGKILLATDKSIQSHMMLNPCVEFGIYLIESDVNSITLIQKLGQDFDRNQDNLNQNIWVAPDKWFDEDHKPISSFLERTGTKIFCNNDPGNMILTVTETYPASIIKRNYYWNSTKELFEEKK